MAENGKELLTAPASYYVAAAQGCREPVGDMLDRLVAGSMAVGVVERNPKVGTRPSRLLGATQLTPTPSRSSCVGCRRNSVGSTVSR